MLLDAERSEAAAQIDADAGTSCEDVQVAATIANLPLQQRTLICLFKGGATYHQIGATLRMSDESVLRDLATLLSQLATQTLSSTEVPPVSH